jgi:anti-sigma B factor antagonist
MTPDPFTLAVGQPDPPGLSAVVAVTGEIDTLSAPDFLSAVESVPGPRPLILDLSRLDYLDSAGFAALDQLLGHGIVVIVLGLSSPVRSAADLMGVPCHDTVVAAQEGWPGSS